MSRGLGRTSCVWTDPIRDFWAAGLLSKGLEESRYPEYPQAARQSDVGGQTVEGFLRVPAVLWVGLHAPPSGGKADRLMFPRDSGSPGSAPHPGPSAAAAAVQMLVVSSLRVTAVSRPLRTRTGKARPVCTLSTWASAGIQSLPSLQKGCRRRSSLQDLQVAQRGPAAAQEAKGCVSVHSHSVLDSQLTQAAFSHSTRGWTHRKWGVPQGHKLPRSNPEPEPEPPHLTLC